MLDLIKMTEEHLHKIPYLLQKLYSGNHNREWCSDLVKYSEVKFSKAYVVYQDGDIYDVTFNVDPDVFLRFFSSIKDLKELLKSDLQKLGLSGLRKIKISPDYERFQVINSMMKPVYTEWEEINKLQEKLFHQLERTTDVLDAKNIGNSSRSIFELLSDRVFDPNLHKSDKEGVDLSVGKYKNRLETFIRCELKGSENEELRKLAISAIDTLNKTIDLANTLTHKKAADTFIAEFCCVATISAISLIKMIKNKN